MEDVKSLWQQSSAEIARGEAADLLHDAEDTQAGLDELEIGDRDDGVYRFLVGDVGGTNTRLLLYAGQPVSWGRRTPE